MEGLGWISPITLFTEYEEPRITNEGSSSVLKGGMGVVRLGRAGMDGNHHLVFLAKVFL